MDMQVEKAGVCPRFLFLKN